MGRRKKKVPLRDDFTDALNEEIKERNIIERTQPEKAVDINENGKVEKVSLEKISVTKVEPVEKIEVDKVAEIPAPQIVEVEVDKKLEERILKEADNTFFEENPASSKIEVENSSPRKSVYRSKAMRRWEAEQKEEKKSSKVEVAPPVEKPRKMVSAEKFGLVASLAMLIYAFVNLDKPLFFLSSSLIIHFLSPIIGSMLGKYNAAAQNALRTFSLVLFFGSILFLFI